MNDPNTLPTAPQQAPAAPQVPAVTMAERYDIQAFKKRQENVEAFFKIMMREGEPQSGADYGTVPGTKSKALFKPGAEKLASFFHLHPRPVCTAKTEQWAEPSEHSFPLFHYEFCIELVDIETGRIVGSGVGSANSYEPRFRYRQGQRVCPACHEPALLRSKFEGQAWYCNQNRGGCGTAFATGSSEATAIAEQEVGRMPNLDIFAEVNNILKRAKKRALVDAVVSVTRAAGLLVEAGHDEEDDDGGRSRQAQRGGGRGTGAAGSGDQRFITEPQLKRLIMIAKKNDVTDERVKAHIKAQYGLTSKTQITREHYEAIVAWTEAGGQDEPEPGTDG